MILDIYVQGVKVGVLEQTDITSFVFTYLPGTRQDRAISLLMPVRTKSWESPFLFPVFQVSLPEGALRQALQRNFSKFLDRFDDMALLGIVGESLIGQVQAVPQGTTPASKSMHQSLKSLLSQDLQEVISHYLGADQKGPGVSGGFLKFLARSPSEPNEGMTRTLTLRDWVVKLNDPDRPTIVLLEHFGMMAARKMGLSVPETCLSPSFDRLLVERFDTDAAGAPLGFEDMCALTGQPANLKFSGSVERIVKIIRTFCSGKSALVSCDAFYAQYLLCNTIRNGDAHLKNFGLLYGPGSAPTLAPVYDMLSMSAYAPKNDQGDAMDTLALTFGGTKRWLKAVELKRLGTVCGVSPARQVRYKERMTQALLDTAQDVVAFQRENPHAGFGPHAARMLELWSYGMREIDGEAAGALCEMSESVGRGA
jgi:serine/threonine-protein kinase HipA